MKTLSKTINLSNRTLRLGCVIFFEVLVLTGLIFSVQAQTPNFPQPEVIAAKQGLPQGFVPGIVQDSQGFMWMATRDGLCRYDGHQFKVYQPQVGREPSLSSLGMESMQKGPDGKIWITSDQGNIDIFNPIKESFINYSRQSAYVKGFGKMFLKSIFPDSQNRLWLVSDKWGISFIQLQTNRTKRFINQSSDSISVGSTVIRDVAEDKNGSIWVSTRIGIFVLAKGSDQFQKYNAPGSIFSRIDSEVYTIRERPGGGLLLLYTDGMATLNPKTGELKDYALLAEKKTEFDHPVVTDSKGNMYFFRMNLLYRFSPQGELQSVPGSPEIAEYKSLFIDASDVLWAGTNGQGVRKFNLRAGYFKVLPYQTDFVRDLFVKFLQMPESQLSILAPDLFTYNFRYTFDLEQNLWFSAGRTPLYKFDLRNRQLSIVHFPVQIKNIKRSELAICLATDPDGGIWAVNDTLVMFYEKGNWQRFKYPVRPGVESGILQVVVDRRALWIATSSKGLYRVDRTNGKIRRFSLENKMLISDKLYCLFSDPLDENLLWIGTFGAGMCSFDKETGFYRQLSKQDGLPNDVVYTAIPDSKGNVWVATNQGLCQVNRKTFTTRTYTREDGLMADEFNRFHFLHLNDDRIFLGGVEGITAFDPVQSNEDQYEPPVHITSILINNEPLLPGKLTGNLPVTATRKIELSHEKNFITVDFAAMQFNRSDKIKYRYQLEGLENNWIETENPVTKYTDLKSGKYLLKLNASNTVGIWSRKVQTLEIMILPPWWLTWWAYIFYGLLILGAGYLLARVYINRLKLRQSIVFKQKEVELKEKESRQLRELDEMKTTFFSNITHEFRTPLTLILAPADQMLHEPRSESDVNRLTLIDRNAHQLLGLVNQLLDLSKLEAGSVTVAEARGDLVDFIDGVVETFEITAKNKGINLTFHSDDQRKDYWFDHEKLERILNNLIANAVKFTNDKGNVAITLEASTGGIQITVSDTGIGIPEGKRDHIFERFYQVDSHVGYQEGSGVGLAIVKELAELQGGTVSVSGNVKEFSTVFTVGLPYRFAGSFEGIEITLPQSAKSATLFENDKAASARILLVEDNVELGDFIAGSFDGTFHFDRAKNGQEGISLALSTMPDLIISDVMMPLMDGYSLCDEVKSNLQTSHIPVILLTARSAMESRMEGLTRGADDYITKPFHLPELKLRIQNLLERQRRFRDLLHARFTKPGILSDVPTSESSDPFLEKFYAILEKKIENPVFGVTELTKEIGMSNSSLNRKLKALTDISAVELIRNYRLKKAAMHLSEGMPVSEAAYTVGFDNLSYFAKCFKDLFQVAPRDFITKV